MTAVTRVVERAPFDLVIYGFQCGEDIGLAEGLMQVGDHHLLLVPSPQPSAPSNILICVAAGEPGKDDVLFAGRLLRHLNADTTLLTVLSGSSAEFRLRTERFLDGGVQSLAVLGVPATGKVRTGPPGEEILAEAKDRDYDLLVLGAPLIPQTGKVSLDGVVRQVLSQVADRSILIVRSHYMGKRVYRLPSGEPQVIIPDSFR